MQKKIIATLVAGLLTACSPQTEKEFFEQAQIEIQEQNYQAAIINLKNAIQAAPEAPLYRTELGLLYSSRGLTSQAEKELSKALELGTQNQQVVLELFRIYNLTEDYPLTLETYKKYTAELSEDNKQFAQIYYAISLFKKGEALEALEQLENAVKLNLKYTSLAKSILAINEGNTELAESEIIKQDLITPNNLFVIYTSANAYFLNQNYPAAIEYFSKYEQAQPAYFPAKLYLANILVVAKEYEKAKPLVDEIMEIDNRQPFAKYLNSVIKFENKDFDQAKIDAEYALSNGVSSSQAYIIAGISNYRLGSYEQAYDHLLKIEQRYKESVSMQKIMTFLRLELGYSVEAADIALEQGNTVEDADLLTSIGLELIREGRTNKAKEIIEKAESIIDSATGYSQTGLLKLYVNDESALDDIEKSLDLDPSNAKVKQLLIVSYIEEKQYNKAHTLAKKWTEEEPKSALAFNMLGKVQQQMGKVKEAEATFDHALKLNPNNGETYFFKTTQLIAEKKTDEALAMSELMLAKAPTYMPGLRLYRYISASQGKYRESIIKLKEIKDNHPNNSQVFYFYISQLMHEKLHSDVISELKDIKITKNLPALHYMALGDAYFIKGLADDAIQVYQTWEQNNRGKSSAPVLKQVSVYLAQNQPQKAQRLLAKKIQGDPNNIRYKLLEIDILIDQRNFSAAKNKLNTLGEYKTAKKALTGKIAFYQKDYESAIEGLNLLYGKNTNSKNAILVFSCLIELNQKSEALSFLEDHLQAKPEDLFIKRILADNYLNQDTEKALKHYQELLTFAPNDAPALNNVAWILMEKNQLTQASEAAEKANKLVPNNPDIIDTYSLILIKQREIKKAIELLEPATLEHANNNQLKVNLAEAYLKSDKATKAKQTLKRISNADTKLELRIKRLLQEFN